MIFREGGISGKKFAIMAAGTTLFADDSRGRDCRSREAIDMPPLAANSRV